MFSRSINCPTCGAENEFVVQGAVLDIDEVCCSRCAEPMGLWADLLKTTSIPRAAEEAYASDDSSLDRS
jgi:endogenous inhibitor of DNA gyrase (YacG/DUF329 family)